MKELVEIKEFLEENYRKFNQSSFIENDPVRIPHRFSLKENIEISGFLSATIAWGNRKSIITNATRLMEMMDDAPYDFVMNHSKKDLKPLEKFVHRTFNGTDCIFFVQSLRNIYLNHHGLESVFSEGEGDLRAKIIHFRHIFLHTKHQERSEKHISDPGSGSAAKRICMYVRVIRMVSKNGSLLSFAKLKCPTKSII